eukprot:NODE_5074_length_702_cov_41.321739_g4911_i0.p2 GENE.NODE_5074_length_702_cov_41.321739_g4911_i0~~NODE_5074_length_702_cov_41.321739_g4911_i0.p2  ORF type:complete len:190 (-),score=69.13 NODE_5074_length_702_cov_41.321739_g4911_i0:71-640(-)
MGKARKRNRTSQFHDPPLPKTSEEDDLDESDEDDDEKYEIALTDIPHGFYEKQIRLFLEQIGHVCSVSLPRCEKTGRAHGSAFVIVKGLLTAKKCINELDGLYLNGEVVRADFAKIQRKFHPSNVHLARLDKQIRRHGLRFDRLPPVGNINKHPKRLALSQKRVSKELRAKGIKYDIRAAVTDDPTAEV